MGSLFGIFVVFFLVAIGLEISIIKISAKNFPEHLSETENCLKNDTEAPKIFIDGENAYNIYTGADFSLPEVYALDNCGQTEVNRSGEIDVNNAGEYTINYSSTDKAGNSAEETITVNVKLGNRGTIYLTFDDGASEYTYELLDTLKKYNVKATFFVTGAGDDEAILREYNEGHAVALHTNSHNYSYIYSSVENYFDDLAAVQERVRRITGENSMLIRFPGGSSNTVSRKYSSGIMSRLVNEVTARGYTYFDWNITSGDAGEMWTTEEVVYNVTSQLTGDRDYIVLQHDVKGFSVKAVESIILYGLENGYRFDKLSSNSITAHHRVNN